MKSGNKTIKLIGKAFEDHHSTPDCDGKWELVLKDRVPYKLDSRFFTILDKSPFVICKKCHATFFAPGFEEWLRHKVALDILKQPGLLSKPLLRFLRNETGKTQKEIAELLSITTEEYNKFESVKNTTRRLTPDRQARLKMIFADLLGIQDPSVLVKMGYVDDNEARVPQNVSGEDFGKLCIG